MYEKLKPVGKRIQDARKVLGITQADLADKLPDKLKQALCARENNPSASLSELAAMMEPPITKPAMNNRMKKLVQLSKEIRQ